MTVWVKTGMVVVYHHATEFIRSADEFEHFVERCAPDLNLLSIRRKWEIHPVPDKDQTEIYLFVEFETDEAAVEFMLASQTPLPFVLSVKQFEISTPVTL